MRSIAFALCGTVLLSTGLLSAGAYAAEPASPEPSTADVPAPATPDSTPEPATPESAPEPAASSQTPMQRWLELATPGPPHAGFTGLAGKWRTRTVVPGQGNDEPQTDGGRCEFEVVLGGRFLRQHCTGTFLGRPYEGIGFEGYDNLRKRYVSLWMDTTSSAMTAMTGSCDDAREHCAYYGQVDEAISGQIGKTIKAEFHRTGDDSMVYEMYDSRPDGEWVRVMDVTYKRAESKLP